MIANPLLSLPPAITPRLAARLCRHPWAVHIPSALLLHLHPTPAYLICGYHGGAWRLIRRLSLGPRPPSWPSYTSQVAVTRMRKRTAQEEGDSDLPYRFVGVLYLTTPPATHHLLPLPCIPLCTLHFFLIFFFLFFFYFLRHSHTLAGSVQHDCTCKPPSRCERQQGPWSPQR
jgi:hypothetical protein